MQAFKSYSLFKDIRALLSYPSHLIQLASHLSSFDFYRHSISLMDCIPLIASCTRLSFWIATLSKLTLVTF